MSQPASTLSAGCLLTGQLARFRPRPFLQFPADFLPGSESQTARLQPPYKARRRGPYSDPGVISSDPDAVQRVERMLRVRRPGVGVVVVLGLENHRHPFSITPSIPRLGGLCVSQTHNASRSFGNARHRRVSYLFTPGDRGDE